MKKTFLLLGVFAVTWIGLRDHLFQVSQASGAGYAAGSKESQEASDDKSQDRHIRRIENGLLPAVKIKGRVATSMSLAARMKFYEVPGVSISFFDQGKIIWTRSYGYADVVARKPVTPDTLFQAASISKPVSGLAALRLVQDGRISLDEDVNVKLKSWNVPENAFTRRAESYSSANLESQRWFDCPWISRLSLG